ncbi:hypothetical protein [Streptomyces lacrimifluminis]
MWASRGGPRWVRGVARVTLTAGEALRRSSRSDRNSGGQQSSSGDGS